MRFFCFSLICFWLAGCQFQVAKEPEALIWHMSAEPDTLNPILATDVYASRINNFLYDNLLERNNETLEFEPELAERWTISADKKTFTFYLRPEVRWQDGHPVTVDDIIYSYQQIMNPKIDAPHMRVYYQEIEKVEKVSNRAVRFIFKRPYFMALNFAGGISILPKHLYDTPEADFNRHPLNRAPVGNGPYRFVRWETGKVVEIERNPDYWGKAPDIERIQFRIIAEDTVALQVLKKGAIDFAGLRAIQWMRQTDSKKFNEHFQKYQYDTPGYSFIGWNQDRPYFQQRSVRRALTQLVNRKAILEKLSFGLGKIVTGPFYVAGPDYNRDVKPYRYNTEQAKKRLTAAGWVDHDGDGIRDREGIPFSFEFLIPSGRRFSEQLATIIKEDFRNAGIDVQIRKLEWALFTQKLNDRSFDAVSLGWSFGYEQDPYQVWHSSQAERGSNFVGFRSEAADRLIDQGRITFDRSKRQALYRELHRLIHEEQPYTFLFSSPSLIALDRRFKNVQVYPIGLDPLEWTLIRD